MIFNYNNPNNIELLIDAAQILHIIYVILVITFVINSFIDYSKQPTRDKILKTLPCVTLFVGLGVIMNGTAVIAISNIKS